ATGKIKNYPIGIPVLKIGQTYQGITAYIGDTTPYVPCGIVVDSVGNIYFTAVPYSNIGTYYFYQSAVYVHTGEDIMTVVTGKPYPYGSPPLAGYSCVAWDENDDCIQWEQ